MKEMFGKNRKAYFVFVCLFFGYLSMHLFNKNEKNKALLSTIFSKISKEDQLILEDFFKFLICRTDFGYVLFGNKPVSDFHYINPNSDFYIFFRMDPENLKIRKGIECWRKCYKLFPSKEYLFNFFGDPSKDEYIEIALINKKRFIKVVQKKLNKFQRVFGLDITAEKLLHKFEVEPDFWENHFDYEMLGILYGYGETNSYFFQRRADVNPDPRSRGRFTLKMRPKNPSPFYSSIEEEYVDLSSKLQPLRDDLPLDRGYMNIPGFLAIHNSEETTLIKTEFIQTRKKMIKIFKNKDFFKKSMQRYMGLDGLTG